MRLVSVYPRKIADAVLANLHSHLSYFFCFFILTFHFHDKPLGQRESTIRPNNSKIPSTAIAQRATIGLV